jgi:hypothetical protein
MGFFNGAKGSRAKTATGQQLSGGNPPGGRKVVYRGARPAYRAQKKEEAGERDGMEDVEVAS